MTFEYGLRLSGLRNVLAAALLALSGLALCASGASATPTHTVLWNFCSDAHQCKSGKIPYAAPIRDSEGNLYGTTYAGGKFNAGVVYKLTPGGTYTALHEFCPRCGDGVQPETNLVIDVNGALYGTTQTGGGPDGNGGGTVFRLTPDGSGGWKFKVLHTFCLEQDCLDGADPIEALTYQGAQSGLPYDATSPLFGATTDGGPNQDGTVFKLKPGKRRWTEKTLYNFCAQANCTDGSQPLPRSSLLLDANGNIFGATQAGGDTDFGVIFELSPVTRATYTEKVVHSFCNCAGGGGPTNVVMDDQGILYGAALIGGTFSAGTVFSLQYDGTNWQQTVLYNFCPGGGQCADGRFPIALTLAPNGDLLGTTQSGGAHFNNGVVFQLHGSTQSVLYSFCAVSGCSDGALPFSGVTLDGAGNIYGTTSGGGVAKKGQYGTLYELTP
jgi:uncharacterized repeat protein (TIGR03803 family)